MVPAITLRPRPRPWSCGRAPASRQSRGGGAGVRQEQEGCAEARARTHLCRHRGRNQGHYSWGHGRITTAANDCGRDPTAAAGAVVLRLCSYITWKQRWGVGDQIRDFKKRQKRAPHLCPHRGRPQFHRSSRVSYRLLPPSVAAS